MSVVLRSSFVTGSRLPVSSSAIHHDSESRSNLHIVNASRHSTHSSARGIDIKQQSKADVSRFIDGGLDKKDFWWAPLFNVSADDQWANLTVEQKVETPLQSAPVTANANPVKKPADIKRSHRGALTDEKARALRKSMRDSETWHDGWYHSAIATRLAEGSD